MSGKAATRARLETHPRPSRYQPIVLRRHHERLTSAVESLPRTAGTNTQPQATHPVPYALTQLPPRMQYLFKAGIRYPSSDHLARPRDSANLLALHTSSTSKQKMTVGSDSGTDLNMVGLDGFLEYGQWCRGRTRGSPSMALVPRPHQHFDEGRDTGGVRREMAARDMGSSSVQEQARVRKDQGWYVRKAGSVGIDVDAM
ncbi:hypothetical protein BU17DRAFT_60051 [Hysterangium stoloniferum]|nr:hypothetical protein BU17DRAFT_60051 [Hysterangium stoloniferum]